MRGGEKVLEVLCERFPDAELFTLLHVPRLGLAGNRSGARSTPRRCSICRASRATTESACRSSPRLIEQFDLDGFDLVLSSSHCVAKSVLDQPRRPSTSATATRRCATPGTSSTPTSGPARLGPSRQRGHATGDGSAGPLGPGHGRSAETGMSRTLSMLRAGSADTIIARRLWYIRRSTLTSSVPDSAAPERYALVVSALVPYKRIDLAIDACRLARVPLKIVGTGPDRARPRTSRRTATSSFWGAAPTRTFGRLYRVPAVVMLARRRRFRHRAARGAGVRPAGRRATPAGGALETVVPGETGVLVDEATPEAFAEAVRQRARSAVRLSAHPASRRAVRPRSGLATRWMALIEETTRADDDMVNRHNRLLVAFHVLTDALLGVSAFIVAYVAAIPRRLIPVTEGRAAASAITCHRAAVHRRCWCRSASICRASTDCAAADRAWTISSPSSSAASWRSCSASSPRCTRRPTSCQQRGQGPRRVRGVAVGVGDLPRPERRR